MGKRLLNSVATKDKGKATITAIKYSAFDRAILFSFYIHFGYGLIGQVFAPES